MATLERRYAEQAEKLNRYGQGHVLAFWDRLDDDRRRQLLDDVEQVDLDRCAPLIAAYVLERPEIKLPARLDPPAVLPAVADATRRADYERAESAGRAAIAAGKVAAFTVAGGQGTRLGYDGPKGAFGITPIRSAPLFQVFAESLLGVERRYGCRPHWYIMTSPSNHAATQAFFEAQGYFGLSPADVMFFPQGQMPAFMPDGKIALAEPHRLALSPDGHGGSLRALAQSGALEDMRERGVEYISYFQVDNPLVKTIDPLFVGLHIQSGSEMSSKAVAKADDLEPVGNFCLAEGRLSVIEYTEFNLLGELAHSRGPDGKRRFDAGSIAIHLLSRQFVERLTAAKASLSLPWHRAEKKVAVAGPDGTVTAPAQPNVVKLETFVFDAIPLARNPIVLHTPREEEFSPVKNAAGSDSPATARRDLVRRAARWLEACGCVVPRDPAGEPALGLEISPTFALDARDLRERLKVPLKLVGGQSLLLV